MVQSGVIADVAVAGMVVTGAGGPVGPLGGPRPVGGGAAEVADADAVEGLGSLTLHQFFFWASTDLGVLRQ